MNEEITRDRFQILAENNYKPGCDMNLGTVHIGACPNPLELASV